MQEIDPLITTQILQMKEFLMSQGIPPLESLRAAINYYSEMHKPIQQWPPRITGLDLMPRIDHFQIPDSGSPPYFQQNPGAVKTNVPLYDLGGSNISQPILPSPDDQTNWLGMSSKTESQIPTAGVNSWTEQKSIPEWRYPVEDSQVAPFEMPHIAIRPSGEMNETEKDMMEYVYQSHDSDDKCAPFNGRAFDMKDRSHRPVPPSEGLGYTNTHPNCKCYWKPTGQIEFDEMTPEELVDIQSIHRKIGQRSHFGTLHKVKKDGELSQRTGHRNYYRKPLKEAIAQVRQEFGWLSDEYLQKAKSIAKTENGKLYLIRASEETITDHRHEGEPYRRKLSGDELLAMARTATNKGMDINHNSKWRTKAYVMDSEYDKKTKSIQMIVLELDDDINRAIENKSITAVSINGGSPRHSSVEPCSHGCDTGKCELCLVPHGVILGELDDIAMTWVVTNPRGIYWNGIHIPHAEPGVKTTIIQPL